MDIVDNKITYLDVVDYWGLKNGDIVFLSSDITDLFYKEIEAGREKPSINKFIDKIQTKLGDNGTLIIPTYNWDFCKGMTFDWRRTKGKTGIIGNTCLKRSDFKRTKHPLYSCAVWGRDKDYLCSLDYESSFGQDSIFHYLENKHAKQIVVNVPLTHCFTMLHYVEDMCKPLAYRFDKTFKADYIDEEGVKREKSVSMFVRNLDLEVITDMEPMCEILIDKEIIRKFVINNIFFLLIDDVSKTIPLIKFDILSNKSKLLCKYKGQ